jgi:membrane-associated phospholipid phosphatase
MKKFRLLIIFLAILGLLSFYIFSRQVNRGFLKQTDFNVTVKLQDNMPKRLDSIWETMSLPVTPVVSVFFVGFLTIAAFLDKKIRFRALLIPLLFVVLVMGELYGKSVVHHPSPPFFMIKNPTTIFPQFYVNEQYSYPSGHTARAVFLGLVVWLVTKKKRSVGLAAGLFVLLVAVGRIYLGHHWLSDVIGGGLLGSAMGLAVLTIL